MNLFKAAKIGSAVVAGLLTAVSASAETWQMPTPYPDATFHTRNIRQFAEDVTAATDGALTIEIHSAGSLFKHPEIRNAVRSRQVQIGEFFMGLLANEAPIFGVDTLPFLVTDYDGAGRLWDATRDQVEKEMAAQGLKVLFSVPWPPQGLYSLEAIDDIDDLRGLKFRAYNANTTRLAELAGAVPTQIEIADLAQAFATGRVEAMITSPSTGVSNKVWDYLGFYNDTQAWIPKNVVVVNQRAFDALDATVQSALIAAAERAQERGWHMSREETAAMTATLAENGITVTTPSAELSGALREIGNEMIETWIDGAGDEGRRLIGEIKE